MHLLVVAHHRARVLILLAAPFFQPGLVLSGLALVYARLPALAVGQAHAVELDAGDEEVESRGCCPIDI